MAEEIAERKIPLVTSDSFLNTVNSNDVLHIEVLDRDIPEIPRPPEKIARYDQRETGKKGPNIGGQRRTVFVKNQRARRGVYTIKIGVPGFAQGYTEAELTFFNGRCDDVPGILAEELMAHPNYEVQ